MRLSLIHISSGISFLQTVKKADMMTTQNNTKQAEKGANSMEITYRMQDGFQVPNLMMPSVPEVHLGKYAELRSCLLYTSYFDVSDTHPSRFARPLPIWTMHPAFEPEVIETLEATFGNLSEKENLRCV